MRFPHPDGQPKSCKEKKRRRRKFGNGRLDGQTALARKSTTPNFDC
jgi:hypothetical protein